MTKNGKLTKIDYANAIIDSILPSNPEQPWTISLRFVLRSALMSSTSFQCARDVLKAICHEAGWTEMLKDRQDMCIAKVNIERELAGKRPIKA